MRDFLETPSAQAVLLVALVCVVVTVSYYLVRRFRDRISDDTPRASDLLTNFREMRHEGDISETEYRNIKTVLGARLQRELRDTEDKG